MAGNADDRLIRGMGNLMGNGHDECCRMECSHFGIAGAVRRNELDEIIEG